MNGLTPQEMEQEFWRIITDPANYSVDELVSLALWAAELERLETRRRVAR